MIYEKKLVYKLIASLLIIHFTVLFFYNLHNIAWIPKNIRSNLAFTESYCNPLFEQYWSMFSNPPKSNDQIYFKFKIEGDKGTHETGWCDIHNPLVRSNKIYIFSFNQRLLKYLSGCMTSIYKADYKALRSISDSNDNLTCSVEKADSIRRRIIQKSVGYAALLNYANLTFKKLSVYKQIVPSDRIYVKMKFVQEEIQPIDRSIVAKSYFFDMDYYKLIM